MKQASQQIRRFLKKISGRAQCLSALSASIVEVVRLLKVVSCRSVPTLDIDCEPIGKTYEERLMNATVAVFRNLDVALPVLRTLRAKDLPPELFWYLNYCFLALFRHSRDLVKDEAVKKRTYETYHVLGRALNGFLTNGRDWLTCRGAYDEFKDSVYKFAGLLVERMKTVPELNDGRTVSPTRVMPGPHCAAFVLECDPGIGSVVIAGTAFYIPPTARRAWDVIVKLVTADNAEGWVQFNDSKWQGLFSRTDKNNNCDPKAGSVRLLKYIHARSHGCRGSKMYRLMPYTKNVNAKRHDGNLPPNR